MSEVLIPAGSNLQEALDTAPPGDTLVLEAGATWVGCFDLPANTSGRGITLTGAATLISAGPSQPVIKTRPQAHQWALVGEPGRPLTLRSKGVSEVVRIGVGGNAQGVGQTLEEMPCGFRFEGLRIEGDPTLGAQRGLSLNCGDTYVARCTIVNIRARNTESQGICGWNGTGPWVIEDCDIQAGGMPFMAGGAPVSIPEVMPTGITFRRNHCWRPLEWKEQPYSCKNLFEIKNGRDVVVEDNLFEYCWEQGQRYAVALTPRVSTNTFWASVKGIRIRRNRFIHAPGGVNILGSDTNNAASVGCADDIVIEDNEFLDIDTSKWGGHGSFIQLVRGNRNPEGAWVVPTNIVVRRNVVENNGNAIWCDSGPSSDRTPIPGVVFTENWVQAGKIRGNGTGENPQTAVKTYLPASTIVDNRLIETAPAHTLLPDNRYYQTPAAFQREFMCWPGYRNLTPTPSARS